MIVIDGYNLIISIIIIINVSVGHRIVCRSFHIPWLVYVKCRASPFDVTYFQPLKSLSVGHLTRIYVEPNRRVAPVSFFELPVNVWKRYTYYVSKKKMDKGNYASFLRGYWKDFLLPFCVNYLWHVKLWRNCVEMVDR